MQRARALENSRQAVRGRGADASVSRPTPLTLVAGAVAGDDLASVAGTVSGALACPVAIAIPELGEPVVSPPDALAAKARRAISAHAAAARRGEAAPPPAPITESVPVRIGEQTVGIVAAVGSANPAPPSEVADRRAWLEAAAQAAAVTALISQTGGGSGGGAGEHLIAELAAGPPADVPGLVVRARRLGCDLAAGAVVVSARWAQTGNGRPAELLEDARNGRNALIAESPPGRLLAIAALTPEGDADPARELVAALRAAGLVVGISAPRRDPGLLHEAVREAELLAELGRPDLTPPGQDDTYRLLIGILLRDRRELEELRDRTITPLAQYDARHDTDLLATLRAFLTHDGSTTETAEKLKLHRHTVGYRLARVQEVSGLSPYESDGRERLSLGIKAQQILEAEDRTARNGA